MDKDDPGPAAQLSQVMVVEYNSKESVTTTRRMDKRRNEMPNEIVPENTRLLDLHI